MTAEAKTDPHFDPENFWAFGYGSLMWRPGFSFEEKVHALCHGYRRDACVYSITYRGTPEQPGLVVGLNAGGSCRGIAFRIAPDKVEESMDYLDQRELVTGVYKARFLSLTLSDGRKIKAYGYVADPDHVQYAGRLSFEEKVLLARQGTGREGRARDYLANVAAHMDEIGLTDDPVHRLVKAVDAG